ncbi:MAG: endolytic transglycosylase MltG [Eggerthellaceae bacterium]|nr:endolytic transglycosylase MltG [Eggerthellaceae bacterium]
MPRRRNITYSAHPTHAARAAHAKGDKAFRTYDTSAIRPKRNPILPIIAIIVLIAAIAAIVFGATNFIRGCSGSNLAPEGTEVQIVIEEGEGAKSVAKSLADAGLISNPNEFTDRISTLGAENNLYPGTYTLVAGQSVDEIIQVLQTPPTVNGVTIPEGSTIQQTAEFVSAYTNGRISADSFVAAASNASAYASEYPFLAEVGENSLEGFLFPKTYPIAEEDTADTVIRAMLSQYASETTSLDWSYAESKGLSRYDAVKLASIVEKESDANYRSTVASVFYNRLADNMRLQSDATVAYVVGHDPTADDVATENEYNTYFIDGLPPTPINSPSLACLKAVCEPEETNYYFFYFEDDGNGGLKYSFSETYEEHQSTYE